MHAARRLSTQNGLGNFLPLELRKVPGSPLCGQNDGEESNLCFFCPWLSWGPPWDRGPQWGGGPVPVGDMFSQRQTSKLPQALLSCLHGGSNAKTVPATRPSLRATYRALGAPGLPEAGWGLPAPARTSLHARSRIHPVLGLCPCLAFALPVGRVSVTQLKSLGDDICEGLEV